MKSHFRLAIGAFAGLLLLIALFPPDQSNGWQFAASGHVHRIEWGLIALESIAALAIVLGLFAFAGKERE